MNQMIEINGFIYGAMKFLPLSRLMTHIVILLVKLLFMC
jgi:hypothetical protein